MREQEIQLAVVVSAADTVCSARFASAYIFLEVPSLVEVILGRLGAVLGFFASYTPEIMRTQKKKN